MTRLVAAALLAAALASSGCSRQCPAGYVNDGQDNCVSDGRGGPGLDADRDDDDDD